MAQLISWDGARIAKEFDDLMVDSFWALAAEGLPEDEARHLKGFASGLVLQNSSGYNRRVMKQLTTDPLVLVNLGASPPDQDCHLRRQVATRLLDTQDFALGANALKVKQRFAEDLALASATGTCGSELYTTMQLARKHLKATVSENERANSMLKIMTKRSPNIGIAFLAARIALKGFFGTALAPAAGVAAKKRVIGEALLDTCIGHSNEGKLVLKDQNRWDVPLPLCDAADAPQ